METKNLTKEQAVAQYMRATAEEQNSMKHEIRAARRRQWKDRELDQARRKLSLIGRVKF